MLSFPHLIWDFFFVLFLNSGAYKEAFGMASGRQAFGTSILRALAFRTFTHAQSLALLF